MITARAAAIMAAMAMLVGGCGSTDQDEAAGSARTDAPVSATVSATAASSPASPTASPAPATTTVPAALAFTAKTLSSEPFEGARLAGKPVVFWFWAPWCPKCRAEAPAVKAAAASFDQVTFVGVAGLDTEVAMKEFVQRTGTGDIVHLADTKGAVWTKLGVSEQSTFVFMKPDGSTTTASGPLGQATLEGHVRQLLGR